MGEARRRYDARNGVERTLILDDAASTFTVHHQQDVEPILDSIRVTARSCATTVISSLRIVSRPSSTSSCNCRASRTIRISSRRGSTRATPPRGASGRGRRSDALAGFAQLDQCPRHGLWAAGAISACAGRHGSASGRSEGGFASVVTVFSSEATAADVAAQSDDAHGDGASAAAISAGAAMAGAEYAAECADDDAARSRFFA